MLTINRARSQELPQLTAWMAAEDWRLPGWELPFLQQCPTAELAVLRDGDRPLGCVSSMAYSVSGWIGNLLVPPSLRGRGYGRQLFEYALARLEGRERVWLTASAQGAPLYARYGFLAREHVVRWAWTAEEGRPTSGPAGDAAGLLAADQACWQEDRSVLLQPLLAAGTVLTAGSSTALLQAGASLRLLGPWYSDNLCPRETAELLSSAIDRLLPGQELAVDLLASSPLAAVVRAAGFACAGRTTLMVRGEAPHVPAHLALASLGSLG